MLTTDQEKRATRNVKWERRFQSVMITVTVAGIIWGIQTLAQVDKTQGLVVQRIDLIEIKQDAAMTSREAARDHSDIHKRLDLNDSAIVIIDGRLKVIEADRQKAGRRK